MKLLIGVLGLAALILFGLHSLAPVFGFEQGLVGDWAVAALVLISLPLGARMAILRHRAKRDAKQPRKPAKAADV